ncbi:MAG TPA: alpha/beta fold hydrolase BchO [Gemmatimonas sp.]|nr:alpha/beta fold hydrolase BchO [Gemmatimonas sp.]
MKEIFESTFQSDAPPPNWPHRHASGAVTTSDLRVSTNWNVRWHVQRLGSGPVLLLLHGTGGSAHSWHHAIGSLAERCTVIAIDLPGHGFSNVAPETDADGRIYALEGMALAVRSLLDALGVQPAVAAGHSAGAAVLVRMALDGLLPDCRLLGFNPALVAPPAAYVSLIAPLVGVVAESPLVAAGAAWLARSTGIIPSMLASTGTALSPADRARYELLCARPAHCHAALSMMSRWDLPKLVRDAALLTVPLELYGGSADRWVPYGPLADSVASIPRAVLTRVEGAGHLIPEERPDVVIGAVGRQL